jgi:hypothetical protein
MGNMALSEPRKRKRGRGGEGAPGAETAELWGETGFGVGGVQFFVQKGLFCGAEDIIA